MGRYFVVVGSVLAAGAVILGAFGAHLLKASVTEDLMEVYQTGVLYHMLHAVGVIIIGIVTYWLPNILLIRIAGWLLILGIVLFSGSLYLVVLLDAPQYGIITPFGGVAFIVAWLLLAGGVFRATKGQYGPYDRQYDNDTRGSTM